MEPSRRRLVERAMLLDSRLTEKHLDLFLEEILKWNPQLGLVSKQTPFDVLDRLIRQSIDAWNLASPRVEPHVPAFVDVGSGGGFPGIIWAMISPDSRGLLVDRKERKAGFLERVVSLSGFQQIEIYSGDAKDASLTERYAHTFDLGCAMAVGPPDKTGALLEPFLRDGGVFVAPRGKGGDPGPQIVGDEMALVEDIRTDQETYLVYKRQS